MSVQDQLPVCGLCGEAPVDWRTHWVFCATSGCLCEGVSMPREMWRRLMDRPKLAPEHVERLRQAVVWMCPADHMTGFDNLGDSIHAALEALGEA